MLSAAQFARAARLLAQHWPRLHPASPLSWELKARRTPFGEESYLSIDAVPAEVLGCRGVAATPGDGVGSHGEQEADDEASSSLEQRRAEREPPAAAQAPATASPLLRAADDAAEAGAAAGICPPCQQQQHLYDIHVVFHHSYHVPCLFLRGYLADGQPLQAQAMGQDFPHWAEHARTAGCDWAFMSPEVHPVQQQLGWLMLHPCSTAELLHLLLDERQQAPPGGRPQDASPQGGLSSEAGQDQEHAFAGTCGSDAAASLCKAAEEDAMDRVPDIDDVPEGRAGEHACPRQEQQGHQGGTVLGPAAPDAELLRYMEAWLRLVCPVVGVYLPLPVPQRPPCVGTRLYSGSWRGNE